jgi:leader peptidase (prepilin peptidase)/N-methyltransferase
VEILSVLLSLIALVQIGWQPLLGPVLLFTYVLIALTFIDIDEQLLPDSMTLPLLGMGLALNSFDIFTSASQAIWGALLGFILLWLIDELYYMIRKRHGIGMGDCKLLAALGAWLGASALAPILLIASVLGLGVAILFIALKRLKYDTPIAFGPFLAIAAWGYLIC